MVSHPPPIVGVTAYAQNANQQYYQFANYIEAIRLGGGIPILLPPEEPHLEPILDRIDALLFTGGGDINPACYGGSDHDQIYRVNDQRDQFEIELAQLALTRQIPILGICRGLQILAVASGTNPLIPHVPEVFGEKTLHRVSQSAPTKHRVKLKPNSRLAKLIGSEQQQVVSWHHQAVATAPEGWVSVGYAEDGLIEALEHKHHPWAIALQWHPEMSMDDRNSINLFKSFVAAATP